ncbi:hypothetical protein E2320_009762 [Naja naja]|nr:hypothetical protein E2320_009762 [Naja naja]
MLCAICCGRAFLPFPQEKEDAGNGGQSMVQPDLSSEKEDEGNGGYSSTAACFLPSPRGCTASSLAWPAVGRWAALEGHLYCAGAERSGGGAHVQEPRYFCPSCSPRISPLRTFTFFLSSPRTTATHVLLLPGEKEGTAAACSGLHCLRPPSGRKGRKAWPQHALASTAPHHHPYCLFSAFS